MGVIVMKGNQLPCNERTKILPKMETSRWLGGGPMSIDDPMASLVIKW